MGVKVKTKGLYLRGKTWWMTYFGPDGKQYWESCKTELKTEAPVLLSWANKTEVGHRRWNYGRKD